MRALRGLQVGLTLTLILTLTLTLALILTLTLALTLTLTRTRTLTRHGLRRLPLRIRARNEPRCMRA